jgi:hypothetical protein
VVALAGFNRDLQSNRCHEIDGCSAPGLSQECADDPMQCPSPSLVPAFAALAGIPAVANVAPTAFGHGANPPEEHFVHGRESAFLVPCNRHDVCYQTCVRVTSEVTRDQEWEAAWHACNDAQYVRMLDVCGTAYPATCPFTLVGGIPDPIRCLRWAQEKTTCAALAEIYWRAVESEGGLTRSRQRQVDYCAG